MHRLYRTPELSTRLGIPEGTLRWMRGQGSGPPFIRIGSRIYYREEEVTAWISSHQNEGTPDKS